MLPERVILALNLRALFSLNTQVVNVLQKVNMCILSNIVNIKFDISGDFFSNPLLLSGWSVEWWGLALLDVSKFTRIKLETSAFDIFYSYFLFFKTPSFKVDLGLS